MSAATSQRDPRLRLWLDGVELDNAGQHVLEFEVEERADAASAFRMYLDLSPIATADGAGDWDLLERGPFLEGTGGPLLQLMTRVTAWFGLAADPGEAEAPGAIVFDGYVTAMEPIFGETRVRDSRLEVSGIDASVLMHFQTVTRTWSEMTDAEIASEIFSKYGFTTSEETIEPTSPARAAERGAMVQRCTDAEFLRLLARRNGYETYVEASQDEVETAPHPGAAAIGHFHRPRPDEGEAQPALNLFPYTRPSLITFSARWDSHRPTRMRSWRLDELSRLIERADIEEPGYPRLGQDSRASMISERLSMVSFGAGEMEPAEGETGAGGGEGASPNHLESSDIFGALTPHHASELRAMATGEFRDADWFVCGRGIVRGERYPQIIRARRPIRLRGAGRLLDGTWYCRTACHRWARDPDVEPGEESDQVTRRYEIDVTLVRHALGPDAGAGDGVDSGAGASAEGGA